MKPHDALAIVKKASFIRFLLPSESKGSTSAAIGEKFCVKVCEFLLFR